MASLYDLELQESNNLISALAAGGQPLSLKMMADMLSMPDMKTQLEDPTTEMGKSYARMKQLEKDMIQIMKEEGMTTELAKEAQLILTRNPASIADLADKEKDVIQKYWLTKKGLMLKLQNKGYTAQEIFA